MYIHMMLVPCYNYLLLKTLIDIYYIFTLEVVHWIITYSTSLA